MRSLRNISIQLLSLVVESISLVVTTATTIVLPGKNKKGNLLSTVFALFLGISEKIMVFEKNIFHKKRLLGHRYIRQCFIIVASLLFLLTSVEWTDAPATNSITTSCAQTQTNNVSTESVSESPIVLIESKEAFSYSHSVRQFPAIIHAAPGVPIYLRVCNIRI